MTRMGGNVGVSTFSPVFYFLVCFLRIMFLLVNACVLARERVRGFAGSGKYNNFIEIKGITEVKL